MAGLLAPVLMALVAHHALAARHFADLERSELAGAGNAGSSIGASAASQLILDEREIECYPGKQPSRVYYTPTYRLTKVGDGDEYYEGSHYRLILKSGQQVEISMPKIVRSPGEGRYTLKQATGEVSERNCFGFATHSSYGIPAGGPGNRGKSPLNMPSDSTPENVAKAMELEGAIYLGRTNIVEKLLEDVNPAQRYYIVAVYIQQKKEYHFHALFANGWHWTSSKISGEVFSAGMNNDAIQKQCPGGSIFKLMKASKSYSDSLGGFYLYPCKEKC